MRIENHIARLNCFVIKLVVKLPRGKANDWLGLMFYQVIKREMTFR